MSREASLAQSVDLGAADNTQPSLQTLVQNLLKRLDDLLLDGTQVVRHIPSAEFVQAAWIRLKKWENDIKNEELDTLHRLSTLSVLTEQIVRKRLLALLEATDKVTFAPILDLLQQSDYLRDLTNDVFQAATNVARTTRVLRRLVDADSLSAELEAMVEAHSAQNLGTNAAMVGEIQLSTKNYITSPVSDSGTRQLRYNFVPDLSGSTSVATGKRPISPTISSYSPHTIDSSKIRKVAIAKKFDCPIYKHHLMETRTPSLCNGCAEEYLTRVRQHLAPVNARRHQGQVTFLMYCSRCKETVFDHDMWTHRHEEFHCPIRSSRRGHPEEDWAQIYLALYPQSRRIPSPYQGTHEWLPDSIVEECRVSKGGDYSSSVFPLAQQSRLRTRKRFKELVRFALANHRVSSRAQTSGPTLPYTLADVVDVVALKMHLYRQRGHFEPSKSDK
ncbi:hypothetical protein EK21DRAFT_87546 [Setomelanomma holmii]|uniref:Uncharacterized protein n=1 Tax=Setomelanomma holmii TaxID=210430 RepID=A0A9P4LQL9_9PLEO|nr:hypothetical protein EK21DRAFT_87546 [Setomelanomma holmii]